MRAKAVVETFSIEQIVPFFQPIFDLHRHKVMRYECLSRIITNDDIIHLPSEFLSIISRAQSNARITQRILEMSSAYCLLRGMSWSINMFQTDLSDVSLMKWMHSLLGSINSNLVGVELSYESVKNHPHLLYNFIENLPNIHVTVDDVHTCDDKLQEVINTGVNALKIRGDLITRFAKSGENKTTLEQLIKCCADNACDLIAEHIEDDNTLDAVTNLGINFGQGYFLSQPQGRMTNLKQV